ncbi:hypothetical protein WJR50_13690 [Catalinimonas sp. 4WD22]|uniref:hypothetical protein n=1 Tax=Catalinimonas locisalis TaxID=3133978 RepID=UPI0031014A93
MDEFVCYEIDFGVGLLCKEEVLGGSFDIRIHNILAKIEFPRIYPLLTHENSAQKELIAPASIPNGYQDLFKWGVVFGINSKNEKATCINTAILICPINENQTYEHLKNKQKDISHAVEVFLDYLRVISKQPLVRRINESLNIVSFQNARMKDQIVIMTPPHMLSQNDLDNKEIETEVSYSDMERTITNFHRSKDWKIPLAYKLLNEARKLFYHQKYRSTVFECATASEVLSTFKLDDHIKICSSNSLKKKVENCNGLMSKYNLASTLGLFTKNYSLSGLAKLRNKAIHAGKTVERKEAAEALKITDDFIYSEVTHLS